MRARVLSPSDEAPDVVCHFDVSPVNCSDSDHVYKYLFDSDKVVFKTNFFLIRFRSCSWFLHKLHLLLEAILIQGTFLYSLNL